MSLFIQWNYLLFQAINAPAGRFPWLDAWMIFCANGLIFSGGYPPTQVEQRQLVNTWLQEQGRQWFDGIFDFATPLASPNDEAVLHPAYDSGDGTHLNDEGYQLMAEAVDLSQLTGSPARA